MLDSLDTPPSGNDVFIWTDYLELRALTSADSCFSRGDLASVEGRSKDLGRGFKVESQWRAVADFAGVRLNDFGKNYPFAVSADGDTLEVHFDNEPGKRMYLGLLLAACMRNIKNSHRGVVARAFEEACFNVFEKLMPEGSTVRATWANGGPEAPYVGTLYDKMVQIARDLRCTPNFEPHDFKPSDSGDGGIDLIAWHDMSDTREGLPIAAGQVGCSREEWRSKQCEASWLAKHSRHFPLMHGWATYYFMPLDLREADGRWAYKSDIGSAIIVDRLRILRLVERYDLLSTMPNMPFIDEALAYRVI